MTSHPLATPEAVLNMPPDCREAWRTVRSAGAVSRQTARPLEPLLCRLNWRSGRLWNALLELEEAGAVGCSGEGWYICLSAAVTLPTPPPAPPAEEWSAELTQAWGALRACEQRLLLRARWRWRSWPNPGASAPRPPQRRRNLWAVNEQLYALEYAYRQHSACRGADGVVSVAPLYGREDGKAQSLTRLDALALLRGAPDGLTVTELQDQLMTVGAATLRKWLDKLQEYGQVTQERVGRAVVWRAAQAVGEAV